MMATPERDTAYTRDGDRTVYTREGNGTGWFVGIIVVLALLAIGYLVFSANSGPSTTVDVNGTPAVTDPAIAPAPMTETPAPMTEAPAPAVPETAPMTEAPAMDAAPAPADTPAGTETPAAPAAEPAAPGV
ncbi:hypothetical protein O9Z70_09865 [Devosia sp. YIM 151766]|uniref:hypothetical protein n=1 Tax=Devosia sp. YIM 151766 TaxID=3017325 RepID=UPI00255C65FA|nr:hypothetical protein [Devosia sp. YIM 151766]WIY51791.1 hypothetical protein O9Z70_09865 [Devosia sp. YIM 151766]